ncbi:SDR family oxidoreductase [Pimelobacter simplex]|uniref:SDR family oxidoreductase n=1 Tax=Nocardioides simplex TaxID=2045 RepID=UPI0019336DF0|nr:SDR family oxidoreductase [Pimelobacter simplex]
MNNPHINSAKSASALNNPARRATTSRTPAAPAADSAEHSPNADLTAEAVASDLELDHLTIVVTGATSGIGRETARVLAGAGARVVLAGRDRNRLQTEREHILRGAPNAEIRTVSLDLTSLASVARAARQLNSTLERIDVLINNAGVMFTPFERTEDGFELQIGTNHLGHFLFTSLLEPLLLRSTSARVLNLSSGGHRLGDVDLSDLLWERRDYDKFDAYGASKTANILFTVELEERLGSKDVHSYAIHPGTVLTDLSRFMDKTDIAEMKARAAQVRSGAATPIRYVGVEHGAATSVWAATTTTLKDRGGLYLASCGISDDVEDYAVDAERANALWELSHRLVTR